MKDQDSCDYMQLLSDIEKSKHSSGLFGIIGSNKTQYFQKWYAEEGLNKQCFVKYVGDGCSMIKYNNLLYLVKYISNIDIVDSTTNIILASLEGVPQENIKLIHHPPSIQLHTICDWIVDNDGNWFLCVKESGIPLVYRR